MNLNELLYEVAEERARQNEKHPVNPKYLYPPKVCQLKEHLKWIQAFNDEQEKTGEHSYYHLIEEEQLEIMTAKTREERHIEIVQAIALLVRLDEDESI